MRLVFLADASPKSGAGHVMRTSAIAEEAISRGVETVFLGSIQDLPWLSHRIKNLGFDCISQMEFFEPIKSRDVLVLDSYLIEPASPDINPQKWYGVVSIADELTPNYKADLVIHPGLDGSWYSDQSTKFLSGAKYVPLRKSIIQNSQNVSGEVEKIVIFGGGADSYGLAMEVANHLVHHSCFRSAVFFWNDAEEIENLDPRFKVRDFGQQLDFELISADLVLTSASTSSLEILARSIPLGVVCAVDNQVGYYKSITGNRFAAPLGERVSTSTWELDKIEISRILHDSHYRRILSSNSRNLIDLNGSSRIVDSIIKNYQKTGAGKRKIDDR